MKNVYQAVMGGLMLLMSLAAEAAVLHAGGGAIQSSVCIGVFCTGAEVFGLTTLKLKDTRLRINFEDTSTLAGVPSNDWRILINDTSNGGMNYFAVEETTAGTVPFKIEAGAGANALYVDAQGEVGIGTSVPAQDLHVVRGNTPALRLEQNGSSGWTPQTWDVAGNETSFFVRDITNGSTLPFRIRTGAPSSAIDIEGTTGDVGMGTGTPTAALHVKRANGTAQVLVEETNAVAAPRTLFQLKNKGNTKFGVFNTSAGVEWAFANPGTGFRLSRQGSGVVEMEIFNNGNMTIAGNLTQNSDVNAKTAISDVDSNEILAKVAGLPESRWEYKDARGEAHIGPMAQDFYAAFGLGATDTGISSIDTAGVALVAIKALAAKNASLEAKNKVLEIAIDRLQEANIELQAANSKLQEADRVQAIQQQQQYEQLKAMLVDLQINAVRPTSLLVGGQIQMR